MRALSMAFNVGVVAGMDDRFVDGTCLRNIPEKSD
jgi:hypothetical protein